MPMARNSDPTLQNADLKYKIDKRFFIDFMIGLDCMPLNLLQCNIAAR